MNNNPEHRIEISVLVIIKGIKKSTHAFCGVLLKINKKLRITLRSS